MDSKDVTLEADAETVLKIINECLKIAGWLIDHKDEIKALINKGWTSAKKIVDYLKKKYGK